MEIKNQVTSLEISKHLKELGVKQDGLYIWHVSSFREGGRRKKGAIDYSGGKFVEYLPTAQVNHRESYHNEGYDGYIGDHGIEQHNIYSAFTVAELGEMLPEDVTVKGINYQINFSNGIHSIGYVGEIDFGVFKVLHETIGLTEADARGKMLIYLLENKLITL